MALNSSFSSLEFITSLGLNKFAQTLEAANLTASYVDICQSELTIFAPTDEAFARLGAQLPQDVQLLRELMCVHITLGNLRRATALRPALSKHARPCCAIAAGRS